MTNTTQPDLNKVWQTYQDILDNDLLEDRREYSTDDYITSYEMTREEADYLDRLVQAHFDAEAVEPYGAPELGETVTESIHQGFDGWSDGEKAVIQTYLNDIGKAIYHGRKMNTPVEPVKAPVTTEEELVQYLLDKVIDDPEVNRYCNLHHEGDPKAAEDSPAYNLYYCSIASMQQRLVALVAANLTTKAKAK